MMQPPTVLTALIVETNYLIASVVEAPLAAAGYRVRIAIDPAEAMEILRNEAVSVALVDFRLQHAEPDGLISALQRLGVPFIFCTAAAVEEVHEHFPNAAVMPKPFSDDQLLAAVSSLALPRLAAPLDSHT